MSDERDPRRDPRAGDILRNQAGCEFYVRRIDADGSIWYQEYGTGDLLDSDIGLWVECAKHDTIVQQATP